MKSYQNCNPKLCLLSIRRRESYVLGGYYWWYISGTFLSMRCETHKRVVFRWSFVPLVIWPVFTSLTSADFCAWQCFISYIKGYEFLLKISVHQQRDSHNLVTLIHWLKPNWTPSVVFEKSSFKKRQQFTSIDANCNNIWVVHSTMCW